MKTEFETLHEMYSAVLRQVRFESSFRNAPRGHSEIEVLGYSGSLKNPRARHCLSPVRRQNIVFNYAEALWYLSGRNDLDFIAYYAPRMRRYSADGVSLPGTGYGKKLFSFGDRSIDQIERAIDVLSRDDADSKRVFIQIFDANEDIYRRNIDVSCTLGLQVLLRDGALHLIAYLRANDAFIGFLSDVFSFTMIQEYLAARLGVPMGSYHHLVGSLHIYEENLGTVDDLLEEWPAREIIDDLPAMPRTSREELADILAIEAAIRAEDVTFYHLQSMSLAPYWREVLSLFALYRSVTSNEPIPAIALDSLHPLHKRLFTSRWPDTIRRTE